MIMKHQLELTFNNASSNRIQTGRQPGIRQPQWWFHHMRQVVYRALDRTPRPTPRPEQIYLSLSRRA